MCRVLAYLGSPVLIDDCCLPRICRLLRQTTEPRMTELLNLGGFGLAAWDQDSPDPARPFTYRTAGVPNVRPQPQVVGLEGPRERAARPRARRGV